MRSSDLKVNSSSKLQYSSLAIVFFYSAVIFNLIVVMHRVVWLVKKQASLQMLATNNLLDCRPVVVCIHFYSSGKAYFLH